MIALSGFAIEGTRRQGYGADDFMTRKTEWYLDWLERDWDFSRSAYIQLENTLKAAGRFNEADSIGMTRASKEYENASGVKPFLSPVHRFTVGYGYGYGYGYHPEWIVPWAAALICVGTLVARRLPW
jgi:hypothetical protein